MKELTSITMQKDEYLISEEQFELIEAFISEKVKEISTEGKEQSDFMRDKDLILSFRNKCGINKQINRLLFGDNEVEKA